MFLKVEGTARRRSKSQIWNFNKKQMFHEQDNALLAV